MARQTTHWFDLGLGHEYAWLTHKGIKVGILERHLAVNKGDTPFVVCTFGIRFKGVRNVENGTHAFKLGNGVLTLREKVTCSACGVSGYITSNKWVPA